MLRVEVANTEYGWVYCLVDDATGHRIYPPRSDGFLWRWTAARAGRKEARIRERILHRRSEEESARRYAKWERT